MRRRNRKMSQRRRDQDRHQRRWELEQGSGHWLQVNPGALPALCETQHGPRNFGMQGIVGTVPRKKVRDAQLAAMLKLTAK